MSKKTKLERELLLIEKLNKVQENCVFEFIKTPKNWFSDYDGEYVFVVTVYYYDYLYEDFLRIAYKNASPELSVVINSIIHNEDNRVQYELIYLKDN